MINYDKLVKRIKKSSNVFVMGHKNLDFDSLGSTLAVNELCNKLQKKCYIIIEESKSNHGIKKALEYIKEKAYKCKIGKIKDFEEKIKEKSLSIIVDTYSEKRSQANKFVTLRKDVLFIDHHLFGKPINDNYFLDTKSSSVCEMLALLFKKKKHTIDPTVATIMITGINIDSNNYTIKTTNKTHDAASFLIKCKGSVADANSFIQLNIESYITLQKTIFKTDFYKKKYAIVIANQKEVYDKSELAIISDTLLQFENIKMSFALGKIENGEIGISSRSTEGDVESVMKLFGGGGSKNNAAAQTKDTSFEKIIKKIKGELK